MLNSTQLDASRHDDPSSAAMEAVACNLCGSSDCEVAYRAPDQLYHPDEWFSVNECRRCGLGFVSPRPSLGEMAKYYPASFFDEFETNESQHRERYEREADIVEKHVTQRHGARLLDIGCANGGFPRAMRERGWQPEGVEVAVSSKAITDFKVYACPFPEIPVNEPRFDAVTAWAVLEHVHDPMAHFRKAASIVHKNGVFAFLVTNFHSLASRRLFGEDVPRHLYFFTESTTRRYLTSTGFELLEARYSNELYSMMPVGWLRYLLYRYAVGRGYGWSDSRMTHDRWLRDQGLPRTLTNLARFAVTHPLSVVDRAGAPAWGKLEMLARRYGIVTYVARRTA